ncbi:type II toxin-antitoxin system PrlF family antitoxin [Halomonas sp. AOP13-D3-9]
MLGIHELATLTSKGQVTLPKSIRQALGVDAGGKVAFDLREDGQVIVSRVVSDHEDPAIGAFLDLLAGDIQGGRHIQMLPEALAKAMLVNAGHDTNLDEEIQGDVVI